MLDLRPDLRLCVRLRASLPDRQHRDDDIAVREVLCRWSMLADDMTLADHRPGRPDTPSLPCSRSPSTLASCTFAAVATAEWISLVLLSTPTCPSSRNTTAGPCGSCIWGRAVCGILGRTRSADDGRVHDRAGAHLQTPETLKMLVDGGKYLSSKLVLLNRWRNLQTVVSSGTGSRASRDRCLANCRIAAEVIPSASSTPGSREIEPQLQEVDAQHAFQSHRWSAPPGFG